MPFAVSLVIVLSKFAVIGHCHHLALDILFGKFLFSRSLAHPGEQLCMVSLPTKYSSTPEVFLNSEREITSYFLENTGFLFKAKSKYPVNMTTVGQWKFGGINEVVIWRGFTYHVNFLPSLFQQVQHQFFIQEVRRWLCEGKFCLCCLFCSKYKLVNTNSSSSLWISI